MRILVARELAGHPFWERNKYEFFLVDTSKGVRTIYYKMQKGVEVEFSFKPDGVYAQEFNCGSGYGKSPVSEPFLWYPHSEYDYLEIQKSEEMRENEKKYEENGYNFRDNTDFQ